MREFLQVPELSPRAVPSFLCGSRPWKRWLCRSLQNLNSVSSTQGTCKFCLDFLSLSWASQVSLVVKSPPTDAGGVDSTPGSRRTPWGVHTSPLQYSCLENPMVREAWLATAHRVAWPKRLSTHTRTVAWKLSQGNELGSCRAYFSFSSGVLPFVIQL